MAKILLQRVDGFNRDQLLTSKVTRLWRSKVPLSGEPEGIL